MLPRDTYADTEIPTAHSLFLSASSAVGIVASVALTFVGLTCCCSREPLISPRPSTVVSERRGIDDDAAAVNNVTRKLSRLFLAHRNLTVCYIHKTRTNHTYVQLSTEMLMVMKRDLPIM